MSNHAGDSAAPDGAPKASEAGAPSSSAAPKSTPAKPPATFAKNGLQVVLVLALLIVLGMVIASHWAAITGAPSQAPLAQNRASSESAADLRREIAELNARLEATEARIAPPDPTGAQAPSSNAANLTDIATRLGGVDARVSLLENRVARAGDKDVQTELQERLTRLEAESSAEGMRRAAQVLALAMLARAAAEANSFKLELDAMSALAPGDASVGALAPFAAQGVPTLAMLSARLPEAARVALFAERRSNSGEGILAWLWANLTSLISVRRVGDVVGGTSADRLARAEADIDRGDLAGAAGETRALSQPAAGAMASWLKDAEARLEVDSALAQLDRRIVEFLAMPLPQATRPPSRRP